MNKFLKLFSILFIVIILTGCGSKNKLLKTCKLTSNDISNGYKLVSEYKILGSGKIVDKVETIETVTSTDKDILDYFDEYLKSTYETYNATYGGYENKVTKSDGKVVSSTTIDYTKMDLKKYVEDNSAMKSYVNSDNKLLLDGLTSLYEALGAQCK